MPGASDLMRPGTSDADAVTASDLMGDKAPNVPADLEAHIRKEHPDGVRLSPTWEGWKGKNRSFLDKLPSDMEAVYDDESPVDLKDVKPEESVLVRVKKQKAGPLIS